MLATFGKWVTFGSTCLSACLIAPSLHATPPEPSLEEAAEAPAGTIEPPRPLDTSVRLPSGPPEAARVVLELTVTENGSVTDVVVIEGTTRFAEAARASAEAWRFRPATKNGKPVPARVRFTVDFAQQRAPPPPAPTEPAPAPEETTAATAAPSPDPSATTASPPIEVVVQGEPLSEDAQTLSIAEVRQVPGAFGDPFRAVDALPGVIPVASGLPYFYLRGAPPGNVGYFVDEVRVPLLYHAFVGPGVLYPATVDRVDVYRGGVPARFGRVAGGVVAARTAALDRSWAGEASLRLVDSGGMLQGPLPGRRGALLASGRYSYTALILSAITPDVTLGYWDYQLMGGYELSRHDTLSVLAFGAEDFLEADRFDIHESRSTTRFHRLDLRWDRQLTHRTSTRAAITLGKERTGDETAWTHARTVGGRYVLRHRADEALDLEAGFDVESSSFDVEAGLRSNGFSADFAELSPTRTELVAGFYAQTTWRPEPAIAVTPGLRADLFHSRGDTAIGVDPRVAARFDVSRRVALEHTIGLLHQSANYVVGIPGARVPALRGGLQRSLQASSGLHVSLPADVTGSLTLFDNLFLNLSDPLGTDGRITVDPDLVDRRTLGAAYGAELSLRRPLTRRVGGFLSYTLSRTTRSYERIHTLAAFDRTHVVQLASAFDLGRRWRLGTRLVAISGVPTRRPSTDGPIFDGSVRGPPFFRVDWRLEKRWLIAKRGYLGIVAEVLNTTLSKEVTRRNCNADGCTESHVGPVVLPSLGLEGRF